MKAHRFDNSYAQPRGQERCAVCGLAKNDPVHSIPQHMDALRRANEVRFAGIAVKRDLRGLLITLEVALYDTRADSLEVLEFLRAAPGWGSVRARMLLDELRISHIKRIRELTPRQKDLLADRVMDRRDAA